MAENGFFLGIETSSEITGLALVKADRLYYELRGLTGSRHNETIFQLLADALKFVEIEAKDLAGIGVSIGPGMFTSLRVGLALVKGLALPHPIPVKGINTLDALASSVDNFAQNNDLVISLIDARKEEVFAAFYRKNQRISEYFIIKPSELVNQIQERAILVGNGVKKYGNLLEKLIPHQCIFLPLEAPLPSVIAFQAQLDIIKGNVSDVSTLQPFYLRPTDAELKRQNLEHNI